MVLSWECTFLVKVPYQWVVVVAGDALSTFHHIKEKPFTPEPPQEKVDFSNFTSFEKVFQVASTASKVHFHSIIDSIPRFSIISQKYIQAKNWRNNDDGVIQGHDARKSLDSYFINPRLP